MKTLQWIILGSVALVLLVLFSPVALVIHIVFRAFSQQYDMWYYFNALAVGVDALGGSFIYGSKMHTISAITGQKAYNGGVWHKYQAKAIDFFFGTNHCYLEAIDEKLIKVQK